MIIGAQLYTVRDACKDLAGLEESLRKVAKIGYTAVQLSGVCAYDPEWMRDRLRECGLSAPITHYDLGKICDATEETIAFHQTFGARYIGLGSMPDAGTLAGYEALKARVIPAVKKIHEAGLKFMYHNHHFEFSRIDGKTILDRMCEDFPADEWGITLDTFWAQTGGGDPAQWLRKLRGRVNCVHFKDMVFDPVSQSVHMAAIGEGNMNYEEILRACDDSGVEYGFVEQDTCYGEEPFACLARSYDYFRAKGLK